MDRVRSWVIKLIRLGLPSTILPLQGSLHPVYEATHQSALYQPAVVPETGILSKIKGMLGPGGQAGPQIIATSGPQQGSAPVLSLVSSNQ